MKWATTIVMTALAVTAAAQQQGAYPRLLSEVGTFFTSGTDDEIVFADGSSTAKLSELKWPIPLSPGARAVVGVQWAPWLEISLGLQAVLPLSSGNMTDDDWNVNGELYDSDGNLCSRFHSDNTSYLTSDWKLRAEAKVPFLVKHIRWWLSTGLEFQQRAWEAWNTVQTNTLADDGSTYTIRLNGLSGTFRQTWLLAYVGGGLSIRWNGLDWSADVRAAPFPYVQQTDAHILRQLTFNETLTGGFSIDPTVSISWPVTEGLALNASAEYEGAFFLRGDEVLSNDGAGEGTSDAGFYSFASGAGAGFQAFSFGLNLVARL